MTVAESARTYVLTLSPVTALVSGRVFMLHLPQTAEPVKLPAILLRQIGDIQFGHLRGTALLKWARVQVDCIALTIKAARELDQTVMGDYAGGVATGLLGTIASVGGSPSTRMIVSPESMGYREDFDAEELKQKRTMRDYKVWIESL